MYYAILSLYLRISSDKNPKYDVILNYKTAVLVLKNSRIEATANQ